jgi:hypothetical protein
MKSRRFASLLIACGLMAPMSSFAFAEDKPAGEPKTEAAPDATKDEAGEGKKAEGPAAPADPQQAALQIAALEAKSTELFDKKDYEGALPLLARLERLLQGDTERLNAVGRRMMAAEEKLKEAGKTAGEIAAIAARDVEAILAKAAAPAGPPSDEDRKPHAKPKDGEAYAVTIQELGNFQFDQEKGGNIPKDVLALNGATVRLGGYMIPLDQADKIKQFVLVPDLFACCFGQPPQVQHSIIVNCPEGKAVSYFPDQIVVEGTLRVEEKKDDGYIVSVFEVACKSVKPAPK